MELTETKKRYLLTIALLHSNPSHPFRPIDLAIQLGVSRASVSRMLLEFVKEGLLRQTRHYYQLSEEGLIKIGPALYHYANYFSFYTNVLGLNGFDANECCLSLLCCLNESTLDHIGTQITNRFQQSLSRH